MNEGGEVASLDWGLETSVSVELFLMSHSEADDEVDAVGGDDSVISVIAMLSVKKPWHLDLISAFDQRLEDETMSPYHTTP